MTGLTFQLGVGLKAVGVKLPAGGPAPAKVPANKGKAQALAFGTGSGQADILILTTRPLANGASETIDLYAGTTLKDVFGENAPLRKVKSIMVWVESGGDAAGVVVGGATSNGWIGFFADKTDKAKVFPSGPPYLAGSPAGVAVETPSDLNLRVENLAAVSVVYGIMIAGTSA